MGSVDLSPGSSFRSGSSITYTIFLFVNPTSGGNKASVFTKSGMDMFRISNPVSASVHIYDIRQGETGKKEGFLKVKEATNSMGQNSIPLYIIAAGGDGTVMWCVDELEKTSVDFDKLVIGVIPFGTGNDFSRALNWMTILENPFDNGLHRFRQLISDWINADIIEHDIWSVKAVVDSYGCFYKVDSYSRKKKVVNKQGKASARQSNHEFSKGIDRGSNTIATELTFRMSNYFSVGVESRIGIGFDRYRTKNAVLNKMRYALEGVKNTFRHTTPVYDIIDKCTVNTTYNKDDSDLIVSSEKVLFVTDQNAKFKSNSCTCSKGGYEFVYTQNSISEHSRQSTGHYQNSVENPSPTLMPCASLIFINIPSFASGNDIWRYCKGNYGIKFKSRRDSIENMLFEQQKMGDEIIECVSFPSAVAIGLEIAIKGMGRRVFQNKGPVRLHFKQKNSLATGRKVYFQVDGEFLIAYHPLYFDVSHSRKIKVLQAKTDRTLHSATFFNNFKSN
ncbi:Diacylglycerol kinase accessory domain protein [Cryptosporidium meleagridis]|uniref:Diacylglycerol kinase n=1 Tax=Cryptosporidium meleagridis TaxID=93969 RepID=A0A2P4YWW3_9CRYT|nr:Diacylglycerol kinase accessory domain protein [Cryptosporidium meleagridis]